jgi:hypothetical protein
MKPAKRKLWRATVATIALLMVLLASPALAADITWDGPTTNNWWSNKSNWDTDTVPEAGDNAFLTNGTTATVNATSPPLLNSVIVDGNFTATQTYYPSGNLSASAETIGLNGVGVYNQYAGSNSVTNDLILGLNAQGIGTYNQTGGSLSVGNFLIVGQAGQGYFNQSNVTNTVGMLVVGYSDVGSGTYTLNNGTLNVNGFEAIGAFGTGTFKQQNGSHTIDSNLYVGQSTGSSGTYTKSSGSLSVGGTMFVGYGGTGSFSSSSGGVSVTNQLIVGGLAGSSGTLNRSSGSLSVGNDMIVGESGTGVVNSSSGNTTVTDRLILGRFAGSSGEVMMTSGNFTVRGDELIGWDGPGMFTKTSGNNIIGVDIVGVDFYVGLNATGTYKTTSGNVQVTGDSFLGTYGDGSFEMTSGNFTSGGNLTLAQYTGSSGTLRVTSGNVTATHIQINGSTAPGTGTGEFYINGEATVTGDVVNDGTVKTTKAKVTWNGTFTNNNVYMSERSRQVFSQDLVVNPDGYLVATAPLTGAGKARDKFILKEDFVITADNNQESLWDTHLALMDFNKGSDKVHEISVAGVNNGKPGKTGGVSNVVTDNYAWGSLDIKNQTINLVDANTTEDKGALYINYLLTGVDVTSIPGKAANITGPSGAGTFALFIYYNPDVNPYLGTATYDFFSGKGKLRPYHTPVPPSVLLMGSGLLGLGLLGWRRKKRG